MRERAAGVIDRCRGTIREATARLSPRQRVVLLAILFTTFVVVDVIYIVQGFRGGPAGSLEIEHIKQPEILKSTQHDTIPFPGTGR